MLDSVITQFDRFLRTVAAPAQPTARAPKTASVASKTSEAAGLHLSNPLTDAEKSHAGGLMRVNHAGEVAAQALYAGQSLFARTPEMKNLLAHAAKEEQDHLAWTHARLDELGARPSLLNPLWYAGAFALGAVSAALGDKASLGFLKATENQVEAHLTDHLETLPVNDIRSREIVEAMREDEVKHAQTAVNHGGESLPVSIQQAMALTSKIMIATAYRI